MAHKYEKAGAAFLLWVLSLGVVLPTTVGVILPVPTYAACQGGSCSPGADGVGIGDSGCEGGSCGGAGGIGQAFSGVGEALGGLMENPIVMLLFFSLLSQLFQQLFQGGATPQRGPAEEQPAFSAGDPTSRFRTGSRFGQDIGGGIASPQPSPSPSSSPALFLAGGTLYPTHVTTSANGTVTVYNTESAARTVGIRRQGQTVSAQQETVAAGEAHVFRFTSSGAFDVCVSGGASPSPTPATSADFCPGTVTVQAP
jgi:hypothetical protein